MHSVNGEKLDINAWATLQGVSDFELSLTRRGKPMTLRYTLEE
jgi:hypothetical protein